METHPGLLKNLQKQVDEQSATRKKFEQLHDFLVLAADVSFAHKPPVEREFHDIGCLDVPPGAPTFKHIHQVDRQTLDSCPFGGEFARRIFEWACKLEWCHNHEHCKRLHGASIHRLHSFHWDQKPSSPVQKSAVDPS